MTPPAEPAGPLPPTVPSVKRRPTLGRVVTLVARGWVILGVVVAIALIVTTIISPGAGPGAGFMLALLVCPFTLIGLLVQGVGWLITRGEKGRAAKEGSASPAAV